MREILFQRALIRLLQAILGSLKGMLNEWSKYLDEKEAELKRQ